MGLKWTLNLSLTALLVGLGLSAAQAQSCSGPVSLRYYEGFDNGSSLSDFPCWSEQYGGNNLDDVEIETNGGDMSGSPSSPHVAELNDGSAWISPDITKLPNGVVKLKVKLAFENNHDGGFEIGLTDQPLSNPNNSLSNYTVYQSLTYVSSSPNTSNFEYTDDENWRTYTLELTNTSAIGNRTHIVFNSTDGTFECGVEDFEVTESLPDDIQANAIPSPETQCGYPNGARVEVEYESRGISTISAGTSFDVSYYFQGNKVTETHTLGQDVSTGGTFTHTFNQTVNLTQDGKRYQISATAGWSQDQKAANDTASSSFLYRYNAPKPQSVLGDTVCNTDKADLKLLNPVQAGNTEYAWFNRPRNGLEVGSGDSITIPNVYSKTGFDSFYVKRRDSVVLPLKITEFRREDFPNENGVELHNISRKKKDFTGWAVVMWAQDLNNPNGFDKQVWRLGAIKPGDFVMGRGGAEFDAAIFINNFGFGGNPDPAAAAVVTPDGEVSDFVATSASASDIQNLSVDVNGYTITYNDVSWSGPAPVNGVGLPEESGEDYWQRVGSSDNDDASDWRVNAMSPNAPNPNFNDGAFSASTCFSPAKAVGVDVRPTPEPGFSVPSPVCATDTVNFADTTVFNGPTSLDYEWTIGSRGQFTIASPQYAFPQSAGEYDVKLKVASQLNCRDSVSRKITVNAEPQAQLDTVIGCASKDVALVDQSQFPGFGSLQYDWSTNNQSYTGKGAEVTFPSAGQYPIDLTVASPAGCTDQTSGMAMINPTPQVNFSVADTCQDDPVQVQNQVSFNGNNSNLSYQWDFDNGQTSQIANPTPQYDTNGRYNISFQTVSNAGCAEQVVKEVQIEPRPFPEFTAEPTCSPRSIEFGSAVDFDGDMSNVSYSWALGDNTAQSGASLTHTYTNTSQYSVELTATSTTSNCANTVVKPVNVEPQPTPDFTTQAVCEGQPTQFQYDGGVSAETYSYDFGDGVTSTQANPSHVYSSLDTFQVQLAIGFNDQECRLTNTKTVSVNPVPEAQFGFRQGAICPDDTVKIVNRSSFASGSVSALNYEYDFGGQATSTVAEPTYTFSEGGVYDIGLKTITSDGCTDSITQTKVVNDQPTADFTIFPEDPATARVTADVNQYPNYNWSFSDTTLPGGALNRPEISYTFDSNAEYTITLMVENRKGCTNELSQLFEPFIGLDDVSASNEPTVDVYPNPFVDRAKVDYHMDQNASVRIDVLSADGKQLLTRQYSNRTAGDYTFTLDADQDLPAGGPYTIRLQIGDEVYSKQLIRAE